MPAILPCLFPTPAEPATLLTDVVLAALSWWFAWKLSVRTADASRRWWSRAFVCVGAGSLVGGLWHGFHGAMSPGLDASWWRLCLLLTLASSLCLWQATAIKFPPQRATFWPRLGWVKALACATVAMAWPEFSVVLADFAASMLFLATRSVVAAPQPGTRYFLAGVALFALGGVVQAAQWAPHHNFNHNDLFHVIQLGGNWLIYLGGRRATA